MIVKKVETQDELQEAFSIRNDVFVKEQGVDAEVELDEYDEIADHVLVYDKERVIGTGRLRIVDGAAKLQRICVLSAYRSKGIGKIIMGGLEHLAKENNATKCILHAQYHAKDFYEKIGYRCTSGIFQEEGIDHVEMEKEL